MLPMPKILKEMAKFLFIPVFSCYTCAIIFVPFLMDLLGKEVSFAKLALGLAYPTIFVYCMLLAAIAIGIAAAKYIQKLFFK